MVDATEARREDLTEIVRRGRAADMLLKVHDFVDWPVIDIHQKRSPHFGHQSAFNFWNNTEFEIAIKTILNHHVREGLDRVCKYLRLLATGESEKAGRLFQGYVDKKEDADG